jgi:hypothetical protein
VQSYTFAAPVRPPPLYQPATIVAKAKHKARSIEFMLLGWNKNHAKGSTVVFLVHDDDLAYFEAMTVRKGKIAGQRLMAALVEIGDDELPVPEQTTPPSGMCGLQPFDLGGGK